MEDYLINYGGGAASTMGVSAIDLGCFRLDLGCFRLDYGCFLPRLWVFYLGISLLYI